MGFFFFLANFQLQWRISQIKVNGNVQPYKACRIKFIEFIGKYIKKLPFLLNKHFLNFIF